jgi:protocatechuate 3,4-dioxygenase beta subunit
MTSFRMPEGTVSSRRIPCLKTLLCLSIVVFLASIGSAQGGSQDSASKQKQKTCTIAGTVVRFTDSAPLKSAIVELADADKQESRVTTVTDSNGRFQLKGLDPARYRLLVSRNSFVSQEYGQRSPGGPGSTLSLSPGQEMNDLLFRMIPSAVIAGRVSNEDGEPLPNAEVTALREAYYEGVRKLEPKAFSQTNDLGEYRLFGLSPGRYFVKVGYKLRMQAKFENNAHLRAADNSVQGYVPEYYPGSPELFKATSVTVKAGEEVSQIDLTLRPINVFSIRGHVYNAVDKKKGVGAVLELVPRSSSITWGRFETQQIFIQKQDGSFEFSDVLPGTYVIALQWPDENKAYFARRNVDVGIADVEGLSLTIAPGILINGHVTWDGKPALESDELVVYLRSAVSGSSILYVEGAKVSEGGVFSLKNVWEDTYRLLTYGESPDCYLKSVRYGASDALEDGFTVQGGSDAALEVTISSQGARVHGTVTHADGLPAAGVWVVLVPDEAHRGQLRLYKKKTTDQYGHFDLRGIAPGNYKLFGWEEVEQGAWEDPDFLKSFEEKGEKMSVQESDSKSIDLVTIKTPSAEHQNP